MPHPYSDNQFVEQRAFNAIALQTKGWASFTLPFSTELDLCTKLLIFAEGLGTPINTRSGSQICDMLSPMEAQTAKSHSLSKIHSIGEFPLHIDTAHWLTPCRYVMLACIFPGKGNRPTLLLDSRQLPLSNDQISLLYSTPFRVKNGRNSFFSAILSKTRPFIRFDAGCMTAISPTGTAALEIFSKHTWPQLVQIFNWEAGKVLLIDNWRLLHGRGHADHLDSDRKLFRISIQ